MKDFDLKKYLKEDKLNENESILSDEEKDLAITRKVEKKMSFDYERGIVKKVIRQSMEDMESNPKLLTRDYIDAIIKDLEDLKISDF